MVYTTFLFALRFESDKPKRGGPKHRQPEMAINRFVQNYAYELQTFFLALGFEGGKPECGRPKHREPEMKINKCT